MKRWDFAKMMNAGSRVQPDLCCTKFLNKDEWHSAYMIVKRKTKPTSYHWGSD